MDRFAFSHLRAIFFLMGLYEVLYHSQSINYSRLRSTVYGVLEPRWVIKLIVVSDQQLKTKISFFSAKVQIDKLTHWLSIKYIQ